MLSAKRWRVATNSPALWHQLHPLGLCLCPDGYAHDHVSGSDTKRTEEYTLSFAKEIHKGLSNHFAAVLPTAATASDDADKCELCIDTSVPLLPEYAAAQTNCTCCGGSQEALDEAGYRNGPALL